ncbi:MAG: hypothetical protein Ct9H300mP25_00200 [Acidobacteriota bacterium]|nr:MAG: hypothetical protein Ct9H300mP25_00200 [Acidobacteriota bacterium]
MNTFAVIILIAVLSEYFLSVVSGILSLRTFSPTLPAEFREVFDEGKSMGKGKTLRPNANILRACSQQFRPRYFAGILVVRRL